MPTNIFHGVIYVSVFFLNNCIYLLAMLGLCGMWTFSTCGKWELLVAAVHGLLIAVASLVVEHEHEDTWASVVVVPELQHKLNSCGTQVSCSMARGIFSDQRSNLCLLHWQADSLQLSHQESPC